MDYTTKYENGFEIVTEKVTFNDGEKQWYKNGERHREDGPAVERADGSKVWYKNGSLHREDGPAVERSIKDGRDPSYYLDGLKYTKEQWEKDPRVKKHILSKKIENILKEVS